MDDEEREDLLIRASSDNEEFTDNEDLLDTTRGNVLHDNKINPFYDKVQFICVSLVLCFSATALIILLPLYLEVVNLHGDAYTAIIFTSSGTTFGLFLISCMCARWGSGVKASLMPPFTFPSVLRAGLIYGTSCFLVIYSLERKKVICHLQDPMKGIVLVFALVYYFFFCRKSMYFV